MSAQIILLLLLVGLFAGFLSGFVGVGGGIIIVPALVYFLGFNQHTAQGTSLGVLLLPVGIFAVMNYYKAGYLDIKAALFISIAFVVGAYFGSKISISLDQKMVKQVFGGFLLLVAIKMLSGK
jgi:uncharacterized membrane protein YfcA